MKEYKVTFKGFTSRGHVEDSIAKGDKSEILEMIAKKETAKQNALDNAEFYASVNDKEKADTEAARARRLTKDIEKLKRAVK